jgi:negative regulator of flagellin synthesis FlgM
MPPIDLPPLRPVGAIDRRQPHAMNDRRAPAGGPASAAPAVEVETPLAGGQPPVDQARVNEIRKAIEADRYPVIPMRVADALIASGLLLRSGK